jgi:hypothetical protein
MSTYDIFLSHSEQDRELIDFIKNSLDAIDLDVYVEELETNYGTDVVESVCKAIENSDYFMAVLTNKSIKSQWVNQEIGYAFANNIDILPIRIGKVKVTGMISNLKGIKSESNNKKITSKIVWHFINENNIKYFTVVCEKCGKEEEWEIPTQEDFYNWKKKEPMICECNCEHINKINPDILLPIK